jgi:hypothetical protein
MFSIERTEDEIDDVLNWASESVEHGTTHYRGMTYEQGVEDALLWISGAISDSPKD